MLTKKIKIRKKYLSIIESENLIGDRFAKVRRIDENGGNGYFSLVFTAKDLQSGDKVALKFYDPVENSNWDRLERFKREEEMLRILDSEPLVINSVNEGVNTLIRPMIDPISGIEIPLSLHYFAMEFANDGNVEDYIYSKKFDAISMLLHFKEMVKALSRVQNKGVCHRDLKPSNFLLIDGKIRLSDFGAAKSMTGLMPDIRSTYKTPVGDTGYIAPELMFSIGIADEFVYLSDIFSMGAILFEMFANTVLTTQIYTEEIFEKFEYAYQVLSRMDTRKRIETYRIVSEDLSKAINLPNINSYNDKVPNSIKNHLNELYKELSAINLFKRLKNDTSIHRKIDICIKILKNEFIYHKWKTEKRRRKLIKLDKMKKIERVLIDVDSK